METQKILDRAMELRLKEIDVHAEIVNCMRDVARTEAWRLTGAKSIREFCAKEMGWSLEATRLVLIELGIILPVERMISADPACQARMNRLLAWRNVKRIEMNIAAFRILSNRTVLEIASKNPQNKAELLAIAGVGEKKLEEFGDEILEVMNISEGILTIPVYSPNRLE